MRGQTRPVRASTHAAATAAVFVVCAGKLILAGEHSVVHQTRALATVIDKRTYCQFDFTPASAAAAAAADAAPLSVALCIQTKQLDEKYEWSYDELHDKAQTLQSQCTMPLQKHPHLRRPPSASPTALSACHCCTTPAQLAHLFLCAASLCVRICQFLRLCLSFSPHWTH